MLRLSWIAIARGLVEAVAESQSDTAGSEIRQVITLRQQEEETDGTQHPGSTRWLGRSRAGAAACVPFGAAYGCRARIASRGALCREFWEIFLTAPCHGAGCRGLPASRGAPACRPWPACPYRG